MIAELYQTTVPNVNLHLKNIYVEGELRRGATIKDYLMVRHEGARQVSRTVLHYNLEAILAVGYRVQSPRGTQFRQGECLVIPKAHIDHFTDIADDLAQRIMVVAQRIGRRMRSAFPLERFRTLTRRLDTRRASYYLRRRIPWRPFDDTAHPAYLCQSGPARG
jgi:Virulence protein RhuM family/HIT domain